MLGKEDVILSIVPHHRTDAILRRVDKDRYDDRDFITTNLIESYDRLMAFVEKHLPDPFYMEGTSRISIRSNVFREVIANSLIHREYLNPYPAKLIIELDKVIVENSNRPHNVGILDILNVAPFPKNPIIAAFFRQINLAEELGSGFRKLAKYGKAYFGVDPVIEEKDIFRFTASLKSTGQVGEQVGEQVVKIIRACKSTKSKQELLAVAGLSNAYLNYKRHIVPLLEKGLIVMTIPDKPSSRNQKYRITEKGKAYLKSKVNR